MLWNVGELQLESAMHVRIVTPMGGGAGGHSPPRCHTKRIIAHNTQRGYITLVSSIPVQAKQTIAPLNPDSEPVPP